MTGLPMTAAEVMVSNPITVGMDDTLHRIHQVFERSRIDHVVVREGQRVVGLIAERDVLRALSPNLRTPSETSRDAATLRKRAHQVMDHHPLVVGPDTGLEELVGLFRSREIDCLPVVDPEMRLLGLVTLRDMVLALDQVAAVWRQVALGRPAGQDDGSDAASGIDETL